MVSDLLYFLTIFIPEAAEKGQEDFENNDLTRNNDNYNQELGADEVEVREVATSMESLIVRNDEDKENDGNVQKTPTTKKWYEGVVVKPVAFRSLAKRNFFGN